MPLFKNIFNSTLPPRLKNRWTVFSLQALFRVTRDSFFLMFEFILHLNVSFNYFLLVLASYVLFLGSIFQYV